MSYNLYENREFKLDSRELKIQMFTKCVIIIVTTMLITMIFIIIIIIIIIIETLLNEGAFLMIANLK